MSEADSFQWTPSGFDAYPPHLLSIPKDLYLRSDQILDNLALNDTQLLLQGTPRKDFLDLAPVNCKTIKDVENYLRFLHSTQRADMTKAPNIGLRDDWFTDKVFGQQTLSGTDPTAIKKASKDWVDQFKTAAGFQGLKEVEALLGDKHNDFFVVDYSKLADALGVKQGHIPARTDGAANNRPTAYGGASVTLFRFETEGLMHPLGIILDYTGPKSKHNVIIFNKRLTSSADGDEANDWPWRYAKMATGPAAWLGHEVGVHLTKAHLVEEACQVAAQLAFATKPDHFIFQLLQPHRDVTFSINKAAREVLVPAIVVPSAGFPANTVMAFMNYLYANFNWNDSYALNDIKKRGFSLKKLHDTRYRNFVWARNVAEMWRIVRNFVEVVLRAQYPGGDADIAADPLLPEFVTQMRGKGNAELTGFPERLDTMDTLIDAITNIIHIATTGHTSINYLQQYYFTFLPNCPSALFTPLPTKLEDLQKYTEQDLLAALPITTLVDSGNKDDKGKPIMVVPDGQQDFRPEWLLPTQVPYLLSFTPPMDKSLLKYAAETAADNSAPWPIRSACRTLKEDLDRFVFTCREFNDWKDDKQTDYLVLDPYLTTSSIIL